MLTTADTLVFCTVNKLILLNEFTRRWVGTSSLQLHGTPCLLATRTSIRFEVQVDKRAVMITYAPFYCFVAILTASKTLDMTTMLSRPHLSTIASVMWCPFEAESVLEPLQQFFILLQNVAVMLEGNQSSHCCCYPKSNACCTSDCTWCQLVIIHQKQTGNYTCSTVISINKCTLITTG